MRSNKPCSITCRCRIMLRSFLNCLSGWEYISAFTCGKNKLWCSSQDSRAGKINTSTNGFGSTRSHRLTHQGFFCQSAEREGEVVPKAGHRGLHMSLLSFSADGDKKEKEERNSGKYSNTKMKDVLSPAYHNYVSHFSIPHFLPFNSMGKM